MTPLAYVSDEMYVALPDVMGEFESLASGEITVLRSSPRGAFYGLLAPGRYRVTLARDGFGSKTVEADIGSGSPPQFRLLSDSPLGYMWPKWAQSGQSAEFRAHASEQYQLTLWRYGLKKELVRIVGWIDEHGPGANRQILPDCDFTQRGVEWNRTGYSSPPMITAPERSGLYYLRMKTQSGASFSFPWVVAPAEPRERVAVLASTNTWNAYNNFGGRSNYINADRLPCRPIVNSRQDLDRFQDASPFGVWKPKDAEYAPLSFDRPEPHNDIFDDPEEPWEPVRGRVQCGLAPAEWRLYAWLEREEVGYDLYAEAQLHDGTLPLDRYRVLIISVHPEYWTREMFAAVKSWVFERGGRLMYLGGNGLNCEVIIDGDAMRCLSHTNSLNGELGGHSEDGSVEYESRMHRTFESEAGLLGVVCTSSGMMTAAPYRVIDASHWTFEGTGLQNGDLFGASTLHERVSGGASGHETDKRSASSPAGTHLLAKGENPDDGGAEMVMFRTSSAGAVFSVGSITWVSALFTDANVSRITGNVLRRFLASEQI